MSMSKQNHFPSSDLTQPADLNAIPWSNAEPRNEFLSQLTLTLWDVDASDQGTSDGPDNAEAPLAHAGAQTAYDGYRGTNRRLGDRYSCK
jgi:hypothetical protein